MTTNALSKPNRLTLKWVWWFIALATAVVIYEWHEYQEGAKEDAKLKKQEMTLQSLMMAHNPPWTNVGFDAIPLKNFIIATGTVENQTEWNELYQVLTNSVAAVDMGVSIDVNVIDTNTGLGSKF